MLLKQERQEGQRRPARGGVDRAHRQQPAETTPSPAHRGRGGGLADLRELSLDSTNITDASAGRLGGFGQLRRLNLYHTFITEKGHRQIREALPRCEIIFDPRSSDPKRRRS